MFLFHPKNHKVLMYSPYIFCSQRINDLVKHGSSKKIFVNKESLHGIASSRVVTLGISN